MDRQAKELSRASLGIFDAKVSPEYEKTARMLKARLSLADVSLGSMIEQDNNQRANVKLIEDFCAGLPTAARKKDYWVWSFSSDDPVQVRNIALNIVWVKSRVDFSGDAYVPFYVVGFNGNIKNITELLLAVAAERSPNENSNFNRYAERLVKLPVSLTLDKKQLEAMENLQGSDFPTPEEITAMFDRDTHTYQQDAHHPRAVRFSGRDNDNLLDLYTLNNDLAVTHLADADMAFYNVNTRLHALAAQFAKVGQLDALLQK